MYFNDKADSPAELQLPITYKCNFDCVMCGMQKKMLVNTDFTPSELEVILANKLFKKIKHVGVNGGEPFLKDNLIEYIQVLVRTLSDLQYIYIISNGYFSQNMFNVLPYIKHICNTHGIKVSLALSVDAVGGLQDFVRGKKNAFDHIEQTCSTLLMDPEKYYDHIDIICTITKHNVYNLREIEAWAERKGIQVNYNIATVHERVYNFDKYSDFSIFNAPLSLSMAMEFFYEKFRETSSQKYFCLYYYTLYKKRLAHCNYRYNTGVTLTPNKQLAYCATFSKELGDAYAHSADELYYDHINYRKQLCREKCSSCSHYSSVLNGNSFFVYINDVINQYRRWH
jgi:MoaA/NifB/PqqE/SkfB family radical SAM enzyme